MLAIAAIQADEIVTGWDVSLIHFGAITGALYFGDLLIVNA